MAQSTPTDSRFGRARAFLALRPRLRDGLCASGIAIPGVLLTLNAYGDGGGFPYARPWQAVVATTLAYLPLVWRRRWPIPVLGAVTVAHLLFLIWVVPEGIMVSIAYLIALFTVGDIGPARWRNTARVTSIAAISATFLASVFISAMPLHQAYAGNALVTVSVAGAYAVFFVGGWMLGDAARHRRDRELLLEQRAAELEVERAENARRAVLAERVRIARELHDVVAHTVSVMGIQAGAARRIMKNDPDAAVEALSEIESTSRSAIAELQRLLAFLRAEDIDVPELGDGADGALQTDKSPQPGINRVDELVSQTASAGVRTDLTIIGAPRDLPAGLSLSVYRIVQEALTNTLKHSGAHKAEVLLAYLSDAVEVEILDDGNGALENPSPEGTGHGLVGMRERTALHQGELQFGERAGGGFRVWARLATGDDRSSPNGSMS